MMMTSWAVCTDRRRVAISSFHKPRSLTLQEPAMRAEIAELKSAVEQSAALLRRRL